VNEILLTGMDTLLSRLKKGERGEKETLLIDSLDNFAGCYSFRLRHLSVPPDPKREMFGFMSG
jgi:hypothetical protein